MTKYHTLRRLDRNLFLTVLEAMTIKSIVSAFLGSGENSSWLAGNTYLLLVSQLVKNAMQESWVQSLSWDNSLEKGKATHPSILVWRIPWTV